MGSPSGKHDGGDGPPILIASHPRSGTHLLIDLIRRHFPCVKSWRLWGQPTNFLYLNLEDMALTDRRVDARRARRLVARPDRSLIKTHFLRDFSQSWVERESGPLPDDWRRFAESACKIYITRDPRRVMASYQQFLSNFDPDIVAMSPEAFMTSPHWTGRHDRLGWWTAHVASWLSDPTVCHVRYQDILDDPRGVIDRIAAFADATPDVRQPLLPKHMKSVFQARMARLMYLSPPSTAVISKSRKQVPQWRAGLSDEAEALLTERLAPVQPLLDRD